VQREKTANANKNETRNILLKLPIGKKNPLEISLTSRLHFLDRDRIKEKADTERDARFGSTDSMIPQLTGRKISVNNDLHFSLLITY